MVRRQVLAASVRPSVACGAMDVNRTRRDKPNQHVLVDGQIAFTVDELPGVPNEVVKPEASTVETIDGPQPKATV